MSMTWFRQLSKISLNVVVERGHVTLTGRVDPPMPRLMRSDARAVADVISVTKAIVVDGRQMSAAKGSGVF